MRLRHRALSEGAHRLAVGGLSCALAGLCSVAGCADPEREPAPPPTDAGTTVSVEARTSYWPTYPCTQCHEHRPGTANPQQRQLSEFHGRANALDHGELEGWCYRCHDQRNVDQLLLPDGRSISFDQAYDHCGACHGEKLVDWQSGIHGLTTGHWNGPRLRRSCTHCHDPHRPAFPTIEAEPFRSSHRNSSGAQGSSP